MGFMLGRNKIRIRWFGWLFSCEA